MGCECGCGDTKKAYKEEKSDLQVKQYKSGKLTEMQNYKML